MALALLRSGLRATGTLAAATNVASRVPLTMFAPRLFTTSRVTVAAAKGNKAPPAAEPVEEAELDEGMYDEEYDPMEGLSSAIRRRVLALKEVQKQYDDINRVYQRELAQLQAKFQQQYSPLFDERKAIITGKKDVPTFDIPDDGEGDEKQIPEFWLMAFMNHDKIGQYITERDAEVLKHLVDVRAEVLTGDDTGFKLFFEFEDNKFFTNKVLEKTYLLEPEDEVIPKQFIGCKIDWKDAALDPTVEQKKKRVKSKDGAKSKPQFVMESVPCESFFNVFDPPQIPENPDELGDEEMGALQEELSADFDIGYAIKDQVIPRAVEWYTGEIAPMGEEFDDEFEGEDFEDEPEDEPAPPPRRR